VLDEKNELNTIINLSRRIETKSPEIKGISKSEKQIPFIHVTTPKRKKSIDAQVESLEENDRSIQNSVDK